VSSPAAPGARFACWLHAAWLSLCALALVSGCDYREVECKDANLALLRCDRCRRWCVSWRYRMPGGWV
jgi:hypothetical protein